MRWIAAIMLVLCACATTPAQVGPQVDGGPTRFESPRQVGVDPARILDLALDDGASSLNPLGVLGAAGEMISGARSGTGAPAQRGEGLSVAINIMLLLTVVTLAPSIMLMTTCFLRIIVVLGLLKQALGLQSLPPSQVILSLALFMTLMVMSPTLDRVWDEAIAPFQRGEVSTYDDLWDRAKQPMRDFMFDQIERTGNWSSVYMVLNYRGVDTSEPGSLTRADVDMITLVPAFMLSELKVAFQMGFKVYLPFLVIDMVIASLLISMSMMMLPPVLISLPFKLMLFVLVDGWELIVGSLMQSFVRDGEGARLSEHAAEVAMAVPRAWEVAAPSLGAVMRGIGLA